MNSQPDSQDHEPRLLHAYPVYHDLNIHYGLHAHEYNEVVLVQGGRYRSRVGGEEHIAVPGDVLFYVARTAHEEWGEGNDQCLTLACAFYWDGFAPDEPVFRRDTQGHIQKLLSELLCFYLFDELNKVIKRCDLETPPILHALIAELERLKPSGPHAMVDKVRAYVRSHMTDPISVEDLADYVGFSSAHFSKSYRATTGNTPWHDVQLMRAEEARRLIINTSLPLREIAPRVGIASEYHLSRLLRSLLNTGVRELRA